MPIYQLLTASTDRRNLDLVIFIKLTEHIHLLCYHVLSTCLLNTIVKNVSLKVIFLTQVVKISNLIVTLWVQTHLVSPLSLHSR